MIILLIFTFTFAHCDRLEGKNGDIYYYKTYESYVDFEYNVDPQKSAIGSFSEDLTTDNNFYAVQFLNTLSETSDNGIFHSSFSFTKQITLDKGVLEDFINKSAVEDFTISRTIYYKPRELPYNYTDPRNSKSTSYGQCYHYKCVENKCNITKPVQDRTLTVANLNSKTKSFFKRFKGGVGYGETKICRIINGGIS